MDARLDRLTLSEQDAKRVVEIDAFVAAGDVAGLIACLDDPSWAVRRTVVAGLAQLGNAALGPLVVVLAGERDSEARLAAAVDALSLSRGDAEEAVERLITESTPAAVLCDAVQVLGRRKARGSLAQLEQLTRHADDNVALAAIEALGRIGGSAGVPSLIELVTSGSFFRAFPAIDVLGRSGDARAIPALGGLLPNPTYSTDAARALGRTGQEGAVVPLAAMLGWAAATHVRVAAVALSDLHARFLERGGPALRLERTIAQAAPSNAVRALAGALGNADTPEKAAIARVLGWIGSEEGVSSLFALLGDESIVAKEAAQALKRFGRAIDAQLENELRRGSSERRLLLLPLVGGRGTNASSVALCLMDATPEVRIAACDALARIGDASLVAELYRRLEDHDARVVQAAQGAIQSLGSAETERRALVAARSPSPAVRRAALRIIAYFGYESAMPLLLETLRDPDERMVELAAAGLAFVDTDAARDALIGDAKSPHARTRAAVMRALGHRRSDAPSVAALREGCGDPDPWVRYYACQALGRLRDLGATPRVLGLLEDPMGQVRVAAVEALAQLGTDEAFDALVATLRSSDPDIRRAAIVGLGQGRWREAIPILVEQARADDAATRLVAIAALAEMNAPEVIHVLSEAARDADASVRSAAVELLIARTGRDAAQALAELIDHPELSERIASALAAPGAGRLEGLEAALLEAPDPKARPLAAVLARAGRAEAEAVLVHVLRRGGTDARRAAAGAMSSLRSRQARSALEEAASRDPDIEVRRAAGLALEQ